MGQSKQDSWWKSQCWHRFSVSECQNGSEPLRCGARSSGKVCLLLRCCCCTPILNVLMSRSAIKGSPLGSVFWEKEAHHPPPPPTDPPLPPPAPGSVRICYSRLHFTRFDLEFWSLFLSAFFPLYFFWLSSISYWLFWFMKFSDDECSEKLALQHWWL